MKTQPISYIVKTPGFRRGEPHVAGRRITVAFIADAFVHDHLSIDDIAHYYELTPAQVYAALAYYYDHVEEIESIWAEEQRAAAEYTPDARELADQQAAMEARFKERDPGGYQKMLEIERKHPGRDMTATEIAQEFGISAQAVREAAAHHRIPARKIGRDWVIKRQDAEQRWGSNLRGRSDKPASGTRTRAASAKGEKKSVRR